MAHARKYYNAKIIQRTAKPRTLLRTTLGVADARDVVEVETVAEVEVACEAGSPVSRTREGVAAVLVLVGH